eukprot:COSAG02_NODE_858_length_16456_cov_7.419698_17_plen_51_part_01
MSEGGAARSEKRRRSYQRFCRISTYYIYTLPAYVVLLVSIHRILVCSNVEF